VLAGRLDNRRLAAGYVFCGRSEWFCMKAAHYRGLPIASSALRLLKFNVKARLDAIVDTLNERFKGVDKRLDAMNRRISGVG
jgi:hypothetical protein